MIILLLPTKSNYLYIEKYYIIDALKYNQCLK